MKETWEKIEAWLGEHSPKALADLRPGASAEAIGALEQQLGFPLPEQLREHLCIHDGQPNESLLGLLDGWTFLACEDIGRAHQTFTRLLHAGDFATNPTSNRDGAVKPVWWSERWIPFLEGPGGDYLCCDMDPAEKGQPGQVITFWHADGDRNVRAKTLRGLLKRFAKDLEEDLYDLEDDGGLWPK